MELELELKAQASIRAAEAKLRMLGASLTSEGEEVDLYFQHPCRDFSSTDEALRLRRRGGAAFLTYKGPRLDGVGACKARSEAELSVSSFEGAAELLRLLGFREVAEIRKHRSVYKLGDLTIHLDRVEGLGEFVEVECSSNTSTLEEAKSRLIKIARELGVEADRATTKSYLELYLEALGHG
ncbi:MAG: class IV adenylate cyclase [Candidatus Nezhaarchaeota archaeon]|nr:class IV adenylate cyclase [Candidatus Nezhaarchaeota archaeon]